MKSRELAERHAQEDSASAKGTRVVCRTVGVEDELYAYVQMEPELWNLLRDHYKPVVVYHRGVKD
jgi:predicted protein tyrosine phosphatase